MRLTALLLCSLLTGCVPASTGPAPNPPQFATPHGYTRETGNQKFTFVMLAPAGADLNALPRSYQLQTEEMAKKYPQVTQDKFHIDILTAHFVQRPDFFDVVVASNLFGDILSDLGPACTGTIGIAPSANLNPDREFPSLFEPVHGSAPDIAGRNIANPIGQIWCGAMMLDFLGHREAHDAVLRAIEKVLAPQSGAPRTRDLGGNASTSDVGRAIAAAL